MSLEDKLDETVIGLAELEKLIEVLIGCIRTLNDTCKLVSQSVALSMSSNDQVTVERDEGGKA